MLTQNPSDGPSLPLLDVKSVMIILCLTWYPSSTVLAGVLVLSGLCLKFIILAPRDTGGRCPLIALVAECAIVIQIYGIQATWQALQQPG